ncbi:phosphatase PAP2 family protein [Martelella alba]|uniref:Phosphatase PAP2 family protein n=1 Tax=Martelella alba TaxID=2590451 RepID=A0A506UK14_9HYPH|nr:phosphatase PAP2 family protein [Martelella alba]
MDAGRARKAFWALLAVWILLLALFYFDPQIDKTITGYFFQPAQCSADSMPFAVCGIFPYAQNAFLNHLRDLFFYLPPVCGVYLLIRLIVIQLRRGRGYDSALARRIMAGIVSLLLGPALLVNGILKEFSHRPRPRNTDLFGGTLGFVPAGDFSGACGSNCSFISGEAAGAGWVFCFALFLLPSRVRTALMPPLIAAALIAPAMRVAFGGHYFSDTALGWLSSVVIFLGIWYLFTRNEAERPVSRPAHLK